RTRASQGSWSRPIRTRSAAVASRASWPGLTSSACGSWSGDTRLSTRTRSPPTASTRARRSVVVVTTGRASPARAAEASTGPASSRTSGRAARAPRTLRLLDEDRLRHHAVDPLPDVHDLADAAVGHHRGQRVRLVPVERDDFLARQEVHRLAGGVDHRLVE